MAWDDEYSFNVPERWSESEANIFEHLVGADPDISNDQTLQLLFDVALFQDGFTPREREGVRAALEDYLYDEYGIDFEEAMDWAAFREWYDGE
ncbi:MAG TPA: hypothetical protein VFI97_03555 [Arthrobacter sp.]|nr:hypothetical protein [Arthrobacter sp.]